jgi:hypothetical protein
MDNINSNIIFEKIDKLYNKTGYFERYGQDIFIAFILCIVFALATCYLHIMNNLKPIKADWAKQRCNPSVIPFAGIINKGQGETSFETTQNNFTYCTQSILSSITDNAFQPFYYILNVIAFQFKTLTEAIVAIRAQFHKMREHHKVMVENIMGRALNITIPIVNIFLVMKSMIGKIEGTITTAIYTLLGSYFGLTSLLLFIVSLVLKILYALVGIITGLWVASIFLPFLIPKAIATTAVMAAILVPLILTQVMMSKIMKLSTKTPPGIPACFAGTTPLTLQDGSDVEIKSVKIGSILSDGSKVNAVMKLSSHNQSIYELGGMFITGNHSVYHEKMGWISVDTHPESLRIDPYDFKDPFVYCINTNTKTIKLGKYTFSDWDDLDDDDFSHLKKCGLLSKTFKMEDIHKVLAAGFHEECLVKLLNGTTTRIADIKVNDTLLNGERVCGIVKLCGQDISSGVNEFVVQDDTEIKEVKSLHCTGNIMVVDPELGVSNTYDMIATGKQEKPEYVYHLLTDWGSFVVDDVRVEDFNSCIEKYLPPHNAQ